MKQADAIDETKNALLSLEHELRLARDGSTPLTRERVAALAFHLGSMIEHIAAFAPHLPENDTEASAASGATSQGLVQLYEEFSGGRDRRLVVARFGARWFVLAGFRTAPLGTYGVHGPYDHQRDARSHAIRMHNEATGKPLWTMSEVES